MYWKTNSHGLTIPPVGTCEICGAPAYVTWYDKVEVTLPDDEEKHYLPGKKHVVCHAHRPADNNHFGQLKGEIQNDGQ